MATGISSYKIILLGEYGVGKSAIFRRFMNNSFTNTSGKNSTIGLDQCTRVIKIGSQSVKLTLWDTGGIERMSFLGSSYYRGSHAALLVYNINNKDTFTVLSQYILDIAMNAEGAKIFLCGNKSDNITPDEGFVCVKDTDLEQFLSQCENVLSGVYNVSCKDSSGLEDMFSDMAYILHKESLKRLSVQRDLIRPEDNTLDSSEKSCC